MDVFSFLGTTAEISITFAGFISVFFVLARRDGSFHPSVALAVQLVLFASVGCLFFSALPLVLAAIGFSDPIIWRTSSGFVLLAGIAVTVFILRRSSDLGGSGSRASVRVGWVMNSLSFVLALMNVVGWPLPPNGGIHLALVWLVLALGALNFVGLVLTSLLRGSSSKR